jgi:hypothetical protein
MLPTRVEDGTLVYTYEDRASTEQTESGAASVG